MGRFSPKSLDLDGKVILVTGGTGSFGRRFIETVLRRYTPRKVIIYSRDELKQSDMQLEMREQFDEATYGKLRFFLGDVRDRERLNQIDGAMPRLNAIPPGCAFNPRCPRRFERCTTERPELLEAGATRAACWLHAPEVAA